MRRFVPSAGIPVLSFLLLSSLSYGQAHRQAMDYDGNPGGVRYLEEGQRPAMIHPTVEAMEAARSQGVVQQASTANDLTYHGGVGGIGVETAPKIYLVLWGSQWNNNDPSGESAILQSFYKGVFGSSWLNSVTQYCQGVPTGTVFCSGAGMPAGNSTGVLAGVWADNASPAPTHPRQSARPVRPFVLPSISQTTLPQATPARNT